MRTINLPFAFTLLLFVASETQAWRAHWFLEGCPAPFDVEAAKLAQEVRQARPGSPVYVPHPYPKTEHAVFANFVEQFREMSFDGEPERDLRALLDQQLIRYEVIEVAEWRHRCGRLYGTTGRRFLLRLFHVGTGEELARMTLHESGLLGILRFSDDGKPIRLVDGHSLESFDEAAAAARAAGINPKDLQYITLGGGIACYDAMPCIAFRQGGKVFFYRSGKLYELEHQKVRVDAQRFGGETPERAAAIKMLRPGERFVTLGGLNMTIAKPIRDQ
jgi:hypothetical protein